MIIFGDEDTGNNQYFPIENKSQIPGIKLEGNHQ